MKFTICRSGSLYDNDESDPPCEGDLSFEEVLRIDQRTFQSEDEYDSWWGNSPWLSAGINHRITYEGIARDISVKMWTIEVSDLESLLEMSRCLGHSFIIVPRNGPQLPHIEIYDGCRE